MEKSDVRAQIIKSSSGKFGTGRTKQHKPTPCGNWRKTLAIMTVALPASVLLPPVWAADALVDSHIDSITLSRGGLAEIQRSTRVSADSKLHLEVPLEQVDDILKSLVVQDPQGSVQGMSLDGLAAVEETFRRLPFNAEQLSSLPKLVATLQGVQIRASSQGRTLQGTVLGVTERPMAVQDGQLVSEPVLSLMNEDGQMEVMRLGTDAAIEILDATMRERIADAARASGRGNTDQVREITIVLAGDSEREVTLSYVVSAPVWKSAYRLVMDEQGSQARLQAWGVIENASGEDWDDISLTLSSGAPVTLTQRLHQRYWHQREEVPVMIGASAAPEPDDAKQVAMGAGHPQLQRFSQTRMAADMVVAEAAPSPRSIAGSSQKADTSEGATQANYRLPHPIDLASGQTLAVPFIDGEIPAQQVSVFQPEAGGTHPIASLQLVNDTGTSLPAGILTVYDRDNGYIGDAQLRELPDGESRMVSFAADSKVEISTMNTPEEQTQVSIVDDTLHAIHTSRRVTTYTIKGAEDAPRTVIIEHPRQDGWDFSSPELDITTPTHYRLRVNVEAGRERDVVATQERRDTEVISLSDTDAGSLFAWSGNAVDADTAKHLSDLAELKRQVSQAQREADEITAQIKRSESSQARVRDNLAAVPPDSELGQRYLNMLENQENRIAQLEDEQQKARATVRERKAAIDAFIHQLSGTS